MLAPGTTFDRYIVESVLGEGGMAVVYAVRHGRLGTRRALKVMSGIDRRLIGRFELEARVQAELRHPNIVEVIDILEVDGVPAILMEMIEGPTLDARIADGPLDPVTAERLFGGIVDGVEHAHRHGVVHRDLKPGNILLAPGLVPKVADFGLARVLADDSGPRRTATGRAMGTPAYMSPEQIRDPKSVDVRTDVFALGCILYEMLTGRRTFEGADHYDTFTAVMNGRYQRPVGMDPRLRVVIEACLLTDREERPADCGAVRWMLAAQPGPARGNARSQVARPVAPAASTMDLPVPDRPRSLVSGAYLLAVGLMSLAVVVPVGGAIGWRVLRDRGVTGGEEAPASVAALSETSDEAATPDPGGSASVAADDGKDSTRAGRRVASKPIRTREPDDGNAGATLPAETSGTAAPAASPSDAVRAGRLMVNVSPGWADVFVDGKKIGQTPIVGHGISPGEHMVRVVNEATGVDETKSVEVVAGEGASVTFGGTTSPSRQTPISVTVIDMIVRNNAAIKSCFVRQRLDNGRLPTNVKLRITIEGDGSVSDATMVSGEWTGSEFDNCLSSAAKGLSFPSFEGPPLTITYPFNV